MLRGLDPAQAEANLDAILAELSKRRIKVLLTGMVAAPNLGPDYAKRFNPIYARLAAKYRVPLYPFFLAGIVGDRSLHIGDIVTVDNRKGEVTSLTTRYVVLKSDDGTEALIPNDTFITSAVISQTYSNRRLRLIIPIQISYSSPVDTAMSIMFNTAKKFQQVLSEPEPAVILKEFADSGIHLELIIWVEDPEGGVLQLRSNINREMWSEFQKNGIDIPFPQREVRLLGAPE
jgi:small-conductance mechanosensitive channel